MIFLGGKRGCHYLEIYLVILLNRNFRFTNDNIALILKCHGLLQIQAIVFQQTNYVYSTLVIIQTNLFQDVQNGFLMFATQLVFIIIIKICLVLFNRVSGHEDGLVLLPESNKVTIFFTSDSERPDTGFNMTFEAVEIKQGNNLIC